MHRQFWCIYRLTKNKLAFSVQVCVIFGSSMCWLKCVSPPTHFSAQACFGSSSPTAVAVPPCEGLVACCAVGCGDASVRASPWPSLGNRFDVQIGLRMLTHIINPHLKGLDPSLHGPIPEMLHIIGVDQLCAACS